jgi:serine-type D-Ala-D-Ala carboxypeptidase/endopeptidase
MRARLNKNFLNSRSFLTYLMMRCCIFILLLSGIFAKGQDTGLNLQHLLDSFRSAHPEIHSISLGILNHDSSIRIHSGINRTNQPIDDKTLYDLGATSEVFTSCLFAVGIQNGTVKPSTFVEELLPDPTALSADVSRMISLMHLSTHTSGIAIYDETKGQFVRNADSEKLDLLFSRIKTKFYGEYAYSELNTKLLAYALCWKKPRSYYSRLKKSVLDEIGMNNTFNNIPEWFNDQASVLKYESSDYSLRLYSNLKDMMAFINGQIHPKNNKIGKAIIETQRVYQKFEDFNMGLGWQQRRIGDAVFFTIPLEAKSTGCFVGFDKINELGIVVLTDANTATDIQQLAMVLYDQLRDGQIKNPAVKRG